MTKVSVKKHLKELQWRLVLVAAFFIAGAVLAYNYQTQLIPALLSPLNGEKLVYLNPAGGFSFIFLISIYAGIALSLPILIQQIYAFLRPALPATARRRSSIIIISSFLLLVAGLAFGYFVAVPNALQFLYGFADQYVDASLTAESYLNFLIAYTIGIGIVFQIPLLLLLINSIKPLTPGGLMRSEKWVVLIAFIIAAIITPTPDPVNQAIIAGPVVVVYQFGVIAVLYSYAKRRRIEKKAVKHAAKRTKTLSDESFQQLILAAQQEADAEAEAAALLPQLARAPKSVNHFPGAAAMRPEAAPVINAPLYEIEPKTQAESVVIEAAAQTEEELSPVLSEEELLLNAALAELNAEEDFETKQAPTYAPRQQVRFAPTAPVAPAPKIAAQRPIAVAPRPMQRPVQSRPAVRSIDGFYRVPKPSNA